MDPGQRDQLITFQRATVASTNDYGETVEGTPTDYATAWAQVRRGTGQERREASQEAGSQAATFVTDWNPTLEAVEITDRIIYRGDTWDIVDCAPDGNSEIQFTAVRST
jgi:SPP1 family predicted phage head-tail adaptor